MNFFSRRSLLSAIGVAIPVGLSGRARAAAPPAESSLTLRLRPFEEAVREALTARKKTPQGAGPGPIESGRFLRVEIGHSDQLWSGVQGCHNDRPFAGVPAGHLKIVRIGSGPGPIRDGVRLHVATVDIALTGGVAADAPGRPLDFSSLPPAPSFA